MTRGYAVVALHNPKTGENVGGAMRAAGVYGASLVVVSGARFGRIMQHPTDTMKAWRQMPVLHLNDPLIGLPYDCTPVAVDLLPDAKPLPDFTHPERAYYIFGPEDGTLSEPIVSQCVHKIYVPTRRCMNLAATVNVVLYDRLAKRGTASNRERVARAICAADVKAPEPDEKIYIGMKGAAAWEARLPMADAAIVEMSK